MKKAILPILAIVLGLSSCDFLDRMPKDKTVPENYFKTETDLKMFTNSLYDNLFDKEPFMQQSDIFFEKGDLSTEMKSVDRVGEPGRYKAGQGGWNWKQLRRVNTLLGNIHKCEDPAAAAEYTGLARFFRARFYYEKVKRFGDVPWYDKEMAVTDPDLYKPRDSREYVMARMIEDIDFAIANLPAEKSQYRVNKWAALMLKAQFCLYEGTFRKYHGEVKYQDAEGNPGRTSSDYLTLAADAADKLLTESPYSLSSDYGAMFRAVDANASEYILAIKMDQTLSCVHNATAYSIMATQGNPGFARKFIDSFLMKSGKTFQETYPDTWRTMTFVDQVKDRDPRLGAIIRLPEYVRVNSKGIVRGPDIAVTSTGYQFDKFVMAPQYETAERVEMSFNDIPVYRFAEAHLIYAEAKAELGTLDQTGLDKSINELRRRANMPKLALDAPVDPILASAEYGYANLAEKAPANLGLLLEIRRERTIELCLETRRWDDIVRWKEGKCYDQELYGMYFPGPGKYDITGDGKDDICLYDTEKAPGSETGIVYIPIQGIEIGGKFVPKGEGVVLSEGTSGYIYMHGDKEGKRIFNESRDYLYPIPAEDRQYNNNLKQNPNWDDGLSF